ncbi:MAG TPA: serine hydrolase domain-containing protein [Candidatus Saccharimonadales bacterium]|nr:serine hydrolase domain-containing protein [Candidatus Saccharimonadales bacterium]
MSKLFLSLPLLTFLLIQSVFPRQVPDRRQNIDFSTLEKVALEELREKNTPGAAVVIVSGDRISYAKGLGVSNIETGAPVTSDMLFRIGSTTKTFTAALLVSLAEEGKLNLNEPIGKYVKGLSPKLSRITSHQLLDDTAGLIEAAPQYGSQEESALARTVRSWTDDLFFLEPDKFYSYSNLGFVIAGLVAEEVGGKPYADLMSERLFKPLGMHRTTFRPTIAMTYPFSPGHIARGNDKPTVQRPVSESTATWPAGFMFSSVDDMARFAIAFMNGGKIDGKQVLSPAVIAKMSMPYADVQSSVPGGFTNGRYSYGLFIHPYRGVQMVWHGGGMREFSSLLVMVPQYRFAIITITNKGGAWLFQTTKKAMELLLPLEPKEKSISEQTLPMTEREMMGYVGTYIRPGLGEDRPAKAEILLKDGGLVLRAFGTEQRIVKVGAHTFSVTIPGESEPVTFSLLPAGNGEAEYLHIRMRVMKRAKDAK